MRPPASTNSRELKIDGSLRCRGQLDDPTDVVRRHRAEPHDDGPGALLDGSVERGLQILGLLDVEDLWLDAKGARRALDRRRLRHEAPAEDRRDALDGRDRLLQQLQPLAAHLGGERAQPRHVAARARAPGDHPGTDRITAGRHDDRDRRRGVLRGRDCRAAGQDGSTFERTSSLARSANALGWPAHRYSITKLRPST
jgi:hypothetical protein